MLSRRTFARLLAATAVVPGVAASGTEADMPDDRFSVMIWTLKSRGSFEENLERVAQAGYRNIELVGEFFHWTDAERARLVARMRSLGIRVDATSGMKLGFADPAGATRIWLS